MITTHVRMGQHVQTLSGDITARVHGGSRENSVIKERIAVFVIPLLLLHYYVILPYKVTRMRKI